MPLDVGPITIQRETFATTIDEAKPLLEAHWRELARNRDLIPLDPDYDRYALIEQSGHLRVYTVRAGAALTGYAVYIVNHHLLWRIARFGKNRPRPSARDVGRQPRSSTCRR